MTRVIYVRHGESMANLLRLYAGHKDFPLSECGLRQAEKIAAYLTNTYQIDMIFSSDLIRASQTAEPTARALGLDIIPMPLLRERGMGVWEGLSHDEIMKFDREELISAREARRAANPAGSETTDTLRQRVLEAEEQILARAKGKCAAVFSHSCVMYTMSSRWEKTVLGGELLFENASITVVDYDDEGVARAIPLLNYQGHLGEDATYAPKHLF